MADKFNINLSLSEFNKLLNQLDKQSKDIVNKIDNEVGAGIEEMALEAKRLAPIDLEGTPISQSIYVQKKKELSYVLMANNKYAAYYEFGTGRHAASYVPTLPKDWEDIARGYYINGKGTIPRTSYFYPSVTAGIPKIIKRINAIFKK